VKPFQMQSYYELLEVPVSATTDQIRHAYERLVAMYSDDQVALYGLAESGSASELRARLHEALEILTDDDLRIIYDTDLGLPPRGACAPGGEGEELSSAQLAMNELLTGADRALQSTHPFVPFSYIIPVAGAPQAVPEPPPPAVVVAPPPPAMVPPPVAVLPDASPTPPPPPAITSSARPEPPILDRRTPAQSENPMDHSDGATEGVPSPPKAHAPAPMDPEATPVITRPLSAPSPPVMASPPTPSAPSPVEATEPPPAVSAPPPGPSAPLAPRSVPSSEPVSPAASAPPPTRAVPLLSLSPAPSSPPRPSPAQAPELAESSAIAVAESQLARVSLTLSEKEVRASAPRPKPPDLPADVEFNGELLRKVRTAMGITLQQISEKTRISSRHLESIEADRYAGLPAPVYLRGILMNLARELGLDGLKVAKSYLSLVEKAKG
jgi:hypothetical protein